MPNYKLSREAEDDLIRIHNSVFRDSECVKQTNNSIHSLNILTRLLGNHSHLNQLIISNQDIDDVFVDLTVFITG